MLEKIIEVEARDTIYRFANPRNVLGTLRRRGLSDDDAEMLLEFLGMAIDDRALESIIAEPFERKPMLGRKFAQE